MDLEPATWALCAGPFGQSFRLDMCVFGQTGPGAVPTAPRSHHAGVPERIDSALDFIRVRVPTSTHLLLIIYSLKFYASKDN